MSLKPGLGATFLELIAKQMKRPEVAKAFTDKDVPNVLNHGPKQWPLGRYLRDKLREKTGIKRNKDKAFEEYGWKMRFMLEEDLEDGKRKTWSPRSIVIERNLQKMRSAEARQKIFKQEETL